MKKTIIGVFSGDKSEFDFDGFSGNECDGDENAIRAYLARFGVETETINDQSKDRKIKVPEGPIKQRIKE